MSRSPLIRLTSTIALITATVAGLGFAACNTHTIVPIPKGGSVQKNLKASAGGQVDMDILWVIDNSGSMCQEQKFLRENFTKFIDQIKDTQLNFHIGITTTHAPGEGSPSIAIVAQEARLQSEPQPVPGPDSACIGDEGDTGNPTDGFTPVRASIDIAIGCLADATQASKYTSWQDLDILCAVDGRSPRCTLNDAQKLERDLNGDGRFDRFDLFPPRDAYEKFPLVLKSEDFRNDDGTLDVARLTRVFGCMSTTGTRGYGYEKGLQVAAKAVGPEFTGYAESNPLADATAPNHGFIRPDANFSVIFVTDENDCSHDGSLLEQSACGGNICEFANTPELGDQSPLVPVEQLKQQFIENLSATKGREVNEVEILVASIHGTWGRYTGPFPDCSASQEPPRAVCNTALGSAQSGDRYERFMRQFPNYFPSDITRDDPTNFEKKELGWICLGDFSPALEAIGQFIAPDPTPCIDDQVYACEVDEDCPAHRYNPDTPGKCVRTDAGYKFCDSGIALVLKRNGEAAEVDDINQLEYCNADTVNGEWGPSSCVIDINRFEWEGCARRKGIRIKWDQDPKLVTRRFTGYDFNIVYNETITDGSE